MNKTVELLPCPFCGNDELTAEPETTYVMCHGCDADGPMTKPGGAITAWNTRTTPPQPDHSAQLYTCIGKGGRYEILGFATGAGLTRSEDRLVCRDATTGRLFLRTEADFSERMERMERIRAQTLDTMKGDAQAVAVVCAGSSTHHGCPDGHGDILSEWLPVGTELYTHADAGEVERLKLMLEEETDRVQIAIKMQQKAITGRDAALARLATAEQLLHLYNTRSDLEAYRALDIQEFLAASAKPEGGEA